MSDLCIYRIQGVKILLKWQTYLYSTDVDSYPRTVLLTWIMMVSDVSFHISYFELFPCGVLAGEQLVRFSHLPTVLLVSR